MDDDFLIETSVDVGFKGKATEKRGIRLPCGIYTSDHLSKLLRTSQPEEVRQDCENKGLVAVKIAQQWVKAFLNTILSEAAKTPEEGLFDLLAAPYMRRGSRIRKREVDRSVYERNQAAAALPAAQSDESVSTPESPAESNANVAENGDGTEDLRELWNNLEPLVGE